eukprot:465755-Alexandrium_andersonii.AAC.1
MDTSHLMRAEEESVAALRKRCSNSLYLAAAILAKDGLQEVARAISTLVRPLYTEHSNLARSLKGPDGTRAYYLGAARGEWLGCLRQVTSCLSDPATSQYLCLDTAFAALPPALTQADARVQLQDSQATACWN